MAKTKKRAVGRPLIGREPMQRVNVMLDSATIRRAERLGQGNLSAGIRFALAVAHAAATKRG